MLQNPDFEHCRGAEPYNGLSGFGLRSVEKYERDSPFVGKNWNRQISTRFIFWVNRIDRPIEATIYQHLQDEHAKDVSVELSSAYGCNVKCSFCASGNLPLPISGLNADEISGQAILLLSYQNNKGTGKDPYSVSFQGIGEPTLHARPIIKASQLILQDYPDVAFKMSTMGFLPDKLSNDFAYSGLPWSSVQVTLPHWSPDKLHEVFTGAVKDYDPGIVLDAVREFQGINPKTKIKFNYMCIKGFNDTTETLERTMDLIEHHGFTFGPLVELKLSYLNPTSVSEGHLLHSADQSKIHSLLEHLQSTRGIRDSYAFGPMQNINVACGQLLLAS